MEDKRDQYAIDEVLQEIFHRRGFDIRNYKISELQSRINNRMDVLGVTDLADYSKYLTANPQEYKFLFNTILVNKGKFFRDQKAWNILKNKVLWEIIERKNEIRIWSAGCGAGEEPYSLAITLADMLGDDISSYNISIYATDIDESILNFARNGKYSEEEITHVPERIKEKYFSKNEKTYTISKDIRRLLIISRHNLLFDPPIPNVDLLICRNVLMYLDRVLQLRIISKLDYALNEMGYLWLGRGETLDTENDNLKPVDMEWRIFKKFPSNEQLQSLEKEYPHINEEYKVIQKIMQNMDFGFIMLDENLNLIAFNHAINQLWGQLSDESLGRSFYDLEISFSPIDLKNKIEQVITNGEVQVIEKTEHWFSSDKRIYLKVEIIPVALAIIILLYDVTQYYEIEEELSIALRTSERAYEKLLSKNNELENSKKQLEKIIEELQSRNEDLKAKNEELNSLISETLPL